MTKIAQAPASHPAQPARGRRGPIRELHWGLAVCVAAMAPTLATAQPTGPELRPTSLDSVSRRLESISPISGPPGTVVTLRTGGMPSITPLRIGVGAVRFGFEEVGQVLTDVRGQFEMTIEIPAWAERNVSHLIIVFDFYFRPIALSDPFHVTDAGGTIERTGTVRAGAECAMLQGDDGVRYALVGVTPGFEPGDRVVVEGPLVEMATCGSATTLRVVRLRHPG